MADTTNMWPTWAQPTGQRTEYPWDDWFNGDIWVLTHGRDFTAKLASFRVIAYAAARRRNIRLKTGLKPDGSSIAIQAVPLTTPAPTPTPAVTSSTTIEPEPFD